MSAALAFPPTDVAELAALPEDARKKVFRWLDILAPLKTCERGVTRLMQQLAQQHHEPFPTVRGKYYAWRNAGWNWRALLDNRAVVENWARRENAKLPAEFIEYWKSLQQRYQRDSSDTAAWRELIRRWRSGQPIPGYRTSPKADPMTGLPEGWSERNLRRYKLSKVERTAARIGRSAASAMMPKVLSTRVGMLVGQMFVVDDQDHDVAIAFLGINRKMSRPSGFNAADFSAAYDCLRGYKPTILNPDGTKQKLRQIDYEWFLVNLLTTIGYRPDTGTIILGEHGTANSSKDFKARVSAATGGKVVFDASGIHGEQLCGFFRGQPRGNPKYKAMRESWFNLFRNEMAALEGATGKDRHHAPEESYGLDLYTRKILDAAIARPEIAEKLMLPVKRWEEFIFLADAFAEIINHRTEHELEGWERMSRVTGEWRLSYEAPWLPSAQYLKLPGPQRAIADALIQTTPGLWRERKLSPAEVWEAGRGELTVVSGSAIPVLLGPDAARRATVTDDHMLRVDDDEVDPEPMWFDAALDNGRILEQRRPVLVYLNPYTPSGLQVCDESGRYLGTAPRIHRISKLDTEALARRYGQVRKIEGRILAPVAARGAEIARQRAKMHEHNAAVLSGHDSIEDQRKSERTARALATYRPDASDLLDPEPEETFTPSEQADRSVRDLI